jgi:hypothetical protein
MPDELITLLRRELRPLLTHHRSAADIPERPSPTSPGRHNISPATTELLLPLTPLWRQYARAAERLTSMTVAIPDLAYYASG